MRIAFSRVKRGLRVAVIGLAAFSWLATIGAEAQQSTVANARTAKDFNTRRPSASMEPSNYPGARFPGIITPRGKMAFPGWPPHK